MCGALGGGLACSPWDSGGDEGADSVSVAFCLGVFVGAEDMAYGECVAGGRLG